jgi:hypothetical protein
MPTSPATKTESTFRLEYHVEITIDADPSAIWKHLTDAPAFAKWNSTVTRIDGRIAAGERLTITVPIAPGREFRPRVVELEPERRMVWSDGMAPMFKGERTYTLAPTDGGTRFEMTEVFRGMMLPMIKRSLPDFRPVFDTYAADLKRVSEHQ